MLYKWIGAGILLLMGGYASVTMNRLEQKRLDVLDSYIALLRYIKGQINCYAMPVSDILETADPLLLSACFGDAQHGEAVGSVSLSTMIHAAHLYLEPESERLLRNFSAELGHTYRAEQVTRCEDYIAALGEERRRLADATPMRLRLNSMLSFCAAFGMAILLW